MERVSLVLAAITTDVTVLGLVGAICSVIGIAMAIISHLSTRKNAMEQASKECHEALLAEQRRTEVLSSQLQKIRLKYGEIDE